MATAARTRVNSEFARDAEPFRRELIAHCYRMLGSLDDAEDVVQETYLRAWRSYDAFENRSSVRTWLHRIATNACLAALQHRSQRVLPSGLGGPSDDPHIAPVPAGPAVAWLQPIPDAVVDPAADDPAAARKHAKRRQMTCGYAKGLDGVNTPSRPSPAAERRRVRIRTRPRPL
jgi:RNA polymerase sigma factor (sigma-70 family)